MDNDHLIDTLKQAGMPKAAEQAKREQAAGLIRDLDPDLAAQVEALEPPANVESTDPEPSLLDGDDGAHADALVAALKRAGIPGWED